MPKKKDGTKITWKEYFKLWKEGIAMITPIQRLKNDVRSNFTMFVGYLVGLTSLIIYFKKFVTPLFTVALIIIFLGAAWSAGIKWWAMKQQLKLFNNFDSNAIDLNKLFDSLEEVKEEEIIKKIEREHVAPAEDELPKDISKSEERIELKGGREDGKDE